MSVTATYFMGDRPTIWDKPIVVSDQVNTPLFELEGPVLANIPEGCGWGHSVTHARVVIAEGGIPLRIWNLERPATRELVPQTVDGRALPMGACRNWIVAAFEEGASEASGVYTSLGTLRVHIAKLVAAGKLVSGQTIVVVDRGNQHLYRARMAWEDASAPWKIVGPKD